MLTADSESLLRSVEIEGRGRALVASQPLRVGQIVPKDSPIHVFSALPLVKPQSSASASYCGNCFKVLTSSENITRCLSCSHYHLFCSPNCLNTAATASHSGWVCKALSCLRDFPHLISQPLKRQVLARFLIATYNLALISPCISRLCFLLRARVLLLMLLPRNSCILISSLCPPPSLSISVDLMEALLAKDRLDGTYFSTTRWTKICSCIWDLS
ncbi:hypothetical protein PTKIN_Ptkin09bG0000100 [Pterospermum kingtungense]